MEKIIKLKDYFLSVAEMMRAGGMKHMDAPLRTNAAPLWPKESRLEHLGKTVRCHVKGFERWLQEMFQDCRPIEEIPSPELDTYLTQYYSSAKTQSGLDFSRKSLLRMRNSLERYLKDQGYPASIVHSPVFAPSLRALKARLRSLFLAQSLQEQDQGQTEPTNLSTTDRNSAMSLPAKSEAASAKSTDQTFDDTIEEQSEPTDLSITDQTREKSVKEQEPSDN